VRVDYLLKYKVAGGRLTQERESGERTQETWKNKQKLSKANVARQGEENCSENQNKLRGRADQNPGVVKHLVHTLHRVKFSDL